MASSSSGDSGSYSLSNIQMQARSVPAEVRGSPSSGATGNRLKAPGGSPRKPTRSRRGHRERGHRPRFLSSSHCLTYNCRRRRYCRWARPRRRRPPGSAVILPTCPPPDDGFMRRRAQKSRPSRHKSAFQRANTRSEPPTRFSTLVQAWLLDLNAGFETLAIAAAHETPSRVAVSEME